MQRSSFFSRNATSLALLGAIIIAAAIVFYLEFTIETEGPNDDKLFGALEFFLSVAIGWVGQSIAAREDLQRNLRQYAISAYRRISDIRRSVNRMHSAIEQIAKSQAQPGQTLVGTLRAIADEMSDTVSSSVLDWADIIGPDLGKVRRIQELQEMIRVSPPAVKTSREEADARSTREIKEEIEKLRSDLPYLLQAATLQEEDVLPREGRYSQVVASHIRNQIGSRRAIDLPINFLGDFTDEAKRMLSEGGPLRLTIEQVMFKLHLVIEDRDGNLLGEVLNPFDEAGVYHNDFVETLLQFIEAEPIAPPGGGRSSYHIPDYEILESNVEGVDFFFRIRLGPQSEGGAP